MRRNIDRIALAAALTMLAVNVAIARPTLEGESIVWHPITITFAGPEASEKDSSPNPFLDIRLQVAFSGPANREYVVPGFFDGDERGGSKERVWRVHFVPDKAGQWRYKASFRTGPGVAILLAPDAGASLEIPNLSGSFSVSPRDPKAPGFLKWGRLGYVDKHYLKFQDGPYWIRGGVDSPENFLAYSGFVRTPPKHKYADHVPDWREGDPDWDDGKGHGIIGALNYLASQHVNSIYFLTMNIGGDGQDVWPWISPIDPKGNPNNDNLHFDTGKLVSSQPLAVAGVIDCV